MAPITALGVGLSGLAFVLAGALVLNCARRRPFEVVGVTLEGWTRRIARSLAILAILGAFAGGVLGLPLVSQSREIRADRAALGRRPAAAVTETWRLPFYVEATTRSTAIGGSVLGGTVERTLQLPWIFLLWVAVHWATVLRRSPSADAAYRELDPPDL